MRTIDLYPFTRTEKALPIPHLIFCNTELYSGAYFSPLDCPFYIKEAKCVIHAMEAAIVISSAFGSREIGNAIAHEWRHHWQFYHGRLPQKLARFDNGMPYREAIATYYQQPHEKDALLYSITAEPTESQREHYAWATAHTQRTRSPDLAQRWSE